MPLRQQEPAQPLVPQQLFEFRGALYGFVAVRLSDYAAGAHPISPSWDTVAMSTGEFRRLAQPVERFLIGSSQGQGLRPVDLGVTRTLGAAEE